MPVPTSGPATGLTITNPLVLYRALLATKVIDPDPAQHRLALELQKLYLRLKDYSPSIEYDTRLKAISRLVENAPKAQDDTRSVAVPGHPLRRNPLFSHIFPVKQDRDSKALTRVLTSHETAINIDSPKGLLLHGEVGTGKSMLVDLLADSLPNKKKRRWHFNTFMLETLARLEQLRQSRSGLNSIGGDTEHSLLWLARDMIDKSPILFLDEFQLPDRAASKILSNLFTTFFQLGGVLIATSNRMPDELSKASGMDFTAPARGGLVRSLLGLGGKSKMDMFPSNNEYAGFVEVLKARCDIWNMDGGRDWRRREAEEMGAEAAEIAEAMREEMVEGFSRPAPSSTLLDQDQKALQYGGYAGGTTSQDVVSEEKLIKATTPKRYFLASQDDKKEWQDAIRASISYDTPNSIPWESTTLLVYGRKVPVPRHTQGVTYWSFPDLCGGTFGPADYITLASTFHTLILDDIPVLALMQKNEARRLITLLDALYEARCKLLIRADAGPDDLFFPEIKTSSSFPDSANTQRDENEVVDAVYPETLSEIYQDQTSPFRPNVSSYTDEPRTGYGPDEDSDFGPLPGKGNEIGRAVDFGNTTSFTGEDERFAYKRARSRLWEMCGARWHARSEPGWWRPLPIEVRRWERSSSAPEAAKPVQFGESDVKLGESVELDGPAGLQGKEMEEREKMASSPFREQRDRPPKIGWAHAWGMMKWGKKAGPWGQGTEGLGVRKREKGER
ncbi:related to ATPase family protein [Phialocephala subalpina]|uniref:Related to ATPase family protein n=1 Tax=Phialocephala subalpina TaxID=576137 RepID=A0A1L7X5W6_9HELO|nr:related to ATPase family protein [Phialocephala subalpina]